MAPVGAVEPEVRDNRVEFLRSPSLTEWYVNSPTGLEQGFTLRTDPAPGKGPLVRIEMAVTGTVRGQDAPAAIDFIATRGAQVIRLGQLQAVDSTGRTLPSWFDLCEDKEGSQAVGIVVDDTGATYPITIDPLATAAAWVINGNDGEWLGHSVATAGDVNGDGYSDVIVGSPNFDDGKGRASVYLGSASGPGLVADWVVAGEEEDGNFGWHLATAGDVNGDGYSDVIIGQPSCWRDGNGYGRAFSYLGSRAGLSVNPHWIAEGDDEDDCLGANVAPAGDLNGDGYSDVIVRGQTDQIAFYYGTANGLEPTAGWTLRATHYEPAYNMGASIAGAGDVNGDGFGDVVFGADSGFFVYYGSKKGLTFGIYRPGQTRFVAPAGDVNGDGYADVLVTPASATNKPGVLLGAAFLEPMDHDDWTPDWVPDVATGSPDVTSISTAGDVDGDGFADIIIGSFQLFKVFVFRGSATGLEGIPSWTHVDGEGLFGSAVATAGDVNGDGYSDIILGARYANPDGAGKAFVFSGAPSGLSLTAAAAISGDQTSSHLGASVAGAGDVNGDGYGDVILGAGSYDNGQSNEGRVFVYYGSAMGLEPSWAWSAEGNQVSAHFGECVAAAGDVDGDGYGDVLIGAPFLEDQGQQGWAFVYHGSTDGLEASAGWSKEGDQTGAMFGFSVAGAGDVNGDGYGDVIVGSPAYNSGLREEGRATLFHGSAVGLKSTPSWKIEGNQMEAKFGWSVASAGDVNADGFSDVVIGVPYFKLDQSEEGRALVYHGSLNGLETTPAWMMDGDQNKAHLGWSVAGAGDVNGDGFSDVVIGAPHHNASQDDEGRAVVIHGTVDGLASGASWMTEGNEVAAHLGWSVAGAGDVNGDGLGDVIVGAPHANNDSFDEGLVLVFHGSESGPSASADWTADGNQSLGGFGYCVASAGDVNGDGYGDVVVGAPGTVPAGTGAAFLYGGNSALARAVRLRQLRTTGDTPIAPLGLSNVETKFRIGATLNSFYGRTDMMLLHEVKPLGSLFDGSGVVEGDFADCGDDGKINFERSVFGLTPGTPYHWRVRARYDMVKTPFQKFGPWYHIPSGGWNETDLRTAGEPPAEMPGDLDGDGVVGGADLGMVLGAWGSCSGCAADLTGDGVVDGSDLGLLLGGWGGAP